MDKIVILVLLFIASIVLVLVEFNFFDHQEEGDKDKYQKYKEQYSHNLTSPFRRQYSQTDPEKEEVN